MLLWRPMQETTAASFIMHTAIEHVLSVLRQVVHIIRSVIQAAFKHVAAPIPQNTTTMRRPYTSVLFTCRYITVLVGF